jgi:molybdate transport system regulatory protein
MNRLPAIIIAVDIEGSIALVEAEVASRRYTAILVGAGSEADAWQPGTAVMLLFKETEVSLAKNLSGALSMRNRFPSVVTHIERGRLLTKVGLDFEGRPLTAIITTRAADALVLAPGDRVEGLVKANEMTVAAGEPF